MPDTLTNGIKGIYQGTYTIQVTDSFIKKPFLVRMITPDSQIVEKATKSVFSMLKYTGPDVVMTNNRLAHLEYGLGDDRLGGAKMTYLDTMIPLKVIGKVGADYKIQLSSNRTAYISEQYVSPMPRGTFAPQSLTDKIRVYADSSLEYVKLNLFQRLPYQSFQLLDPSRIVVDVFGATSNTNWINFPDTLREIKQVSYEQVSDGIFRISISLKHKQHWGHRIYYDGNNLVVQVRRQPSRLTLDALTIAVDAGHGGSNTGAGGPTGSSEKELTLLLSMELKDQLQKAGAHVMMTRETEMFVDNKDRILMYRDSTPDLLVSFHLNSSADPIHVSGTSVFYRYEGFKAFGNSIYKHLLQLGMKEYGNNGAFNFMLNGPTEYPNALIETLFLSNPEEEMKILDAGFRKKLVSKVVEGIKEFLQNCKQ
jgi:N-acetylmuramoyl-L-alanine amidase